MSGVCSESSSEVFIVRRFCDRGNICTDMSLSGECGGAMVAFELRLVGE